MPKKRGLTARVSNKQVRALIRQIYAAGGDVTHCANGHLRVIGPVGIAIVAHDPGNARGWQNALTSIRRHAGLEVTMPN